MRFQRVKKVDEISIPGVSIQLDETEQGLRGVAFTKEDGSIICRVAMEAYNLQFQRPADPKTKDVHRLSGNILSIPVLKDFDTEWEAKNEANRLRSGLGSDLDVTLMVEKVTVEVE